MSRAASTAVLDASIETAADRLGQHAANAELFARELAEQRPDLEVRIPHQVARTAGLDGACSSLVFLIYPPGASVLDDFETWAARAEQLVGRPMVRHGYGWTGTHGRAYGPNKLNAPAGTEYIRFSVGLEPPEVLSELAGLMAR